MAAEAEFAAHRSPSCDEAAGPAAIHCADFGPLAGVYRWMEWLSFGPWLQRCRCAWLEVLEDRRQALVLGDGDGRFTKRLLERNATVVVDAIDASPAMLEALVRRAGSRAMWIRPRAEDVRTWEPGAQRYDLIASHFLLDCLTTAEAGLLAQRLRGAVGGDGVWLVSEFAIPPSFPGRVLAGPLVAGLYLAFGWLTGLRIRQLPDHAAALQAAGFSLRGRKSFLGGLLASEIWQPVTAEPRQAPYKQQQ